MYNIKNLSEEQTKLQDLLDKIADEDYASFFQEDKLNSYSNKIEEIYAGGFRHRYSSLYAVVLKVARQGDDAIDEFQNKLAAISESLNSKKTSEEVQKCFFKLCDHLTLETRRWQEKHSLEGSIVELEKQVNSSKNTANDTDKKVSKMQTDFVAILAIFASVVIAFSSGSNYFFNSIAAVAKAPFQKLASIVIICGIVLANVLFMLMHCIGRIIGRDLGIKWRIVVVFNIFMCLLLISIRYKFLQGIFEFMIEKIKLYFK